MTTKNSNTKPFERFVSGLGTMLFYLAITLMVFTPAGYTAHMLA